MSLLLLGRPTSYWSRPPRGLASIVPWLSLRRGPYGPRVETTARSRPHGSGSGRDHREVSHRSCRLHVHAALPREPVETTARSRIDRAVPRATCHSSSEPRLDSSSRPPGGLASIVPVGRLTMANLKNVSRPPRGLASVVPSIRTRETETGFSVETTARSLIDRAGQVFIGRRAPAGLVETAARSRIDRRSCPLVDPAV